MTQRARQYHRTPVRLRVEIFAEDSSTCTEGVATDISLGGMFIVTSTPVPFLSNVTVRLQIPGVDGGLELPSVVRWTTDIGIGVQLGLLGVRATHAITELARAPQYACVDDVVDVDMDAA